MDERAPQIRIAALADPQQLCFSPGRVLSRDQAQPGSEVTPFDECRSVSDRSHHSRRYQRAYSGDLLQSLAHRILLRDPFDLLAGGFDLRTQRLPFLPQLIQHLAQQWRQIEFGIFQDQWHAQLQVLSAAAEGDPSFQQERPDLVDHTRRRDTNRSRTRCSACRSSWSWVLIGTNRMVGLCTASAIASASL